MLIDFPEGKEEREGGRERNIDYLPLTCALTRDQTTTHTCALTRN